MARESRLQPLARAVLRTQADHRLVALVRDGKEAAFEEIVRRYRAPLVAFAAAYGPPDPEDVVQESLSRSWDALRESSGEMNLKAWLYTIVRNRALNARRDNRPSEPLTEEIDGVPQPPELALTNDELQRVVVAIGALPEAQREALVRSALEGHTHDQIAAAIGSTPGAVRQLIFRARGSVRHAVGAVLPLPLVAALVEASAGAGAGTAAGGAAAAGAAGGTSLAAKTALVAAIGAVAIGSGAALEHAGDADKPAGRSQAAETVADRGRATNDASSAAETPAVGDDSFEGLDDHGRDRGDGGSGDSGEGSGGDDSGPGSDDSGSSGGGSGPSGDGGSAHGDDSPNAGPGSISSGSGSSGSGDSGSGGSDDSGSGGSGSGSGSSGSGSGSEVGGSSGPGSGGGDATTTVPELDSSGPGGGDDLTTTVPELDSSGSGGGGELEPADD